jgi:hypothetical protein
VVNSNILLSIALTTGCYRSFVVVPNDVQVWNNRIMTLKADGLKHEE